MAEPKAFSGLRGRLAVLLALLCLVPANAARPQGLDCGALRTAIDNAPPEGDMGRSQAAIRQQRMALQRSRDDADEQGCTGTAVLDDLDLPQCQAINRRLQRLEDGLQRLESQEPDAAPDGGGRRRALIEQYNAYCGGAGDETERAGNPDGGGVPAALPVDPESPADAPAPATKASRVICVRQCDGAFYPLAVDVAADRLDGMNQICQAQCPNAAASAYTARADEDIGKAVAADGSTYSALPAAFSFQKAVTPGCTCRAPHASWAETLAQSEAMLEPRQGDVTVTPALAAAMARPIAAQKPPVPPQAAAPGEKSASGRKATRKKAPPATTEADNPATGPDAGADVTRQFRRSGPTL